MLGPGRTRLLALAALAALVGGPGACSSEPAGEASRPPVAAANRDSGVPEREDSGTVAASTADEPHPGPAAAPAIPAPVEPSTPAKDEAGDDLPAMCSASEIDVGAAFEEGACRAPEPDPLPPAVVASLEPAQFRARRGQPVHGFVRFENRSARPADLFLTDACYPEDRAAAIIERLEPSSPGLRRVDAGGATCGSGSHCSRRRHRFRIPAGGVARLAFEASTRVLWTDEKCRSTRRWPVAPGHYRLVVFPTFTVVPGDRLEADLVIE